MNEPRVRNGDGEGICDECGTSIMNGPGRDYAGMRMCSGCVDMYETGVDCVDEDVDTRNRGAALTVLFTQHFRVRYQSVRNPFDPPAGGGRK